MYPLVLSGYAKTVILGSGDTATIPLELSYVSIVSILSNVTKLKT